MDSANLIAASYEDAFDLDLQVNVLSDSESQMGCTNNVTCNVSACLNTNKSCDCC